METTHINNFHGNSKYFIPLTQTPINHGVHIPHGSSALLFRTHFFADTSQFLGVIFDNVGDVLGGVEFLTLFEDLELVRDAARGGVRGGQEGRGIWGVLEEVGGGGVLGGGGSGEGAGGGDLWGREVFFSVF